MLSETIPSHKIDDSDSNTLAYQPVTMQCHLPLVFTLLVGCLAFVTATSTTSPHEEVKRVGDPPVFPTWPFVIHTWPWSQAADAAYAELANPTSDTPALDAIVAGCSRCEVDQCDGTVGYGGSPDENGETTLDALIIDGVSLEAGSVGALRNVKNAIGVARAVMEYTKHTLLVGDQATEFALSMGFTASNLSTPASTQMWETWEANNCQPNMRQNVSPDPTKNCGPYTPVSKHQSDNFRVMDQSNHHATAASSVRDRTNLEISQTNHDTIAMVVIDVNGNMAAGSSTNGMSHKIPGRVGDSPILGSGAWVDSDWGGCGATGDGDIMMRFAPCYQAVQNLRAGHTPRQAAEDALGRIERFFDFAGALVVIDREGNYGAASWGMPFSYSVRTGQMNATQVIQINPGEWEFTRPMGQQRRKNRSNKKQLKQ